MADRFREVLPVIRALREAPPQSVHDQDTVPSTAHAQLATHRGGTAATPLPELRTWLQLGSPLCR